MGIFVDKIKKRRCIALSCRSLLLEKGIKNVTVSEFAKAADISKGSVYDYFKNKEDIVFEIIRSYIEEYHKDLNCKFDENTTTKEKVFLLFDFFLSDDIELKRNKELYKEYLSISLGMDDKDMNIFNTQCSDFLKNILKDILEDGIKKGEIVDKSIDLAGGLLALERGYIVMSWTEENDLKNEFRSFINTIFTLMEVKK